MLSSKIIVVLIIHNLEYDLCCMMLDGAYFINKNFKMIEKVVGKRHDNSSWLLEMLHLLFWCGGHAWLDIWNIRFLPLVM